MVEESPGAQVVTQLRKGVLEYCVLRLLDAGPAYGLELANKLSENGLVSHGGSLYPLLSRLRKQELVETFWQESDMGPPRKYYRQTPNGRAALRQFLPGWRAFVDKVDQLMKDVEK